VTRVIFPAGWDSKGRFYDDYRWSRFKHLAPAEMFTVVADTTAIAGATAMGLRRPARRLVEVDGLEVEVLAGGMRPGPGRDAEGSSCGDHRLARRYRAPAVVEYPAPMVGEHDAVGIVGVTGDAQMP
jgi:hypothetical protein